MTKLSAHILSSDILKSDIIVRRSQNLSFTKLNISMTFKVLKKDETKSENFHGT